MKPRLRALTAAIVAIALLLLVFAIRGPAPRNPLVSTPLAQLDPHAMVAAQGLIDDIAAYVALISAVHGDPFRIVTADAFAARAATLERRVRDRQADSLPLIEAYYVLQELAATVQDEHTEIVFPHHWDAAFGPRFPLDIRMIGDRAYVEQCFGSDTIPRHAEVVAVDSLTVPQIVEQVLPYQSHTLAHFKRQVIAASFGRWLQAYFGLRSPWSVTYRAAGRWDTVEVSGVASDAYRAAAGRPEDYAAAAMTVGDTEVPTPHSPPGGRPPLDRRRSPCRSPPPCPSDPRHDRSPTMVTAGRSTPGASARKTPR